MKVPLQWLREYVPLAVSIPELIDRLTIAGLEVTSIRLFGLPKPEGLKTKQEEPGPIWDRDKILIGQVLEITKHPNADKLKLVQLDLGTGTPKQVVTGAPNIAVGEKGHKVIIALTGSVLFDGHATPKKLSELKPTELRGVPSDSMVCSAYELGIHDDHDGIILLEDEAPVGKPLMDYMGDAVLDIDVLPNMARCLSIMGIAREVAAITNQQTCLPKPEPKYSNEAIEGKVKVEIADPKLCGRYTAMIIRDVVTKPSPGWMQRRLQYSGMRPISNIVDITNYVMLEYGQPLHAFDYDVLVKRAAGKAPTIIVRPAQVGEKLRTLDKQERELTPDHLIIADTAGPIALAGVMGGEETEVSDKTKTILLESANFDFVSIRKTAQRFTLFSEASTRFSRGIHTEVASLAAMRAAELMHQYANGSILKGIVDNYPTPTPKQTILLQKSAIRRLLGIDLPTPEIERILQALHFQLEPADGESWQVTTPPNRVDIQAGAADLIEEIARIYGYDHLPSTLLSGELPPQKNNRSLTREEHVRDVLSRLGLQEAMTYSLTSPEVEARLEPKSTYVELLNPVSPEQRVMRQSVLASLLQVTQENLKTTDTLRLFELGLIYQSQKDQQLPKESRRLAIVLTGKAMDFFDIKGVMEQLSQELHLPAVKYQLCESVAYLHPKRSAQWIIDDEVLGAFGELHPKALQNWQLQERTVLVAEIDLERLLQIIPERFAYKPISSFPSALRDVAVIIDEPITHAQLEAEMIAAGGELLQSVKLFDLYRGDPIPTGKKSMAFALRYQAKDSTLSDKEIDKLHKKIEDRLRQVLKAQIRGKD